MKWAYYNENNPGAVQWLRQLIKDKIIMDGEVDDRSITEIHPDELRGFRRCHFFAGIGGWDYALQLAGWPDDRPVWTGSCPCQSFSQAGKQKGFDDSRHLWPHWLRLIAECRPATVFGEQVAAAIGFGWLDLVATDLEKENYAVGPAILGAHSAGAFHNRERLYFVANSNSQRRDRQSIRLQPGKSRQQSAETYRCGDGGMGNAKHQGCQPRQHVKTRRSNQGDGRHSPPWCDRDIGRLRLNAGANGGMGDAQHPRPPVGPVGRGYEQSSDRRTERTDVPVQLTGTGQPALATDLYGCETGKLCHPCGKGLEGHAGNEPAIDKPRWNGANPARPVTASNLWETAEWLLCEDGKYRAVKPGIQPMAARLPAGMVYGGDQVTQEYANNTQEARKIRLIGYGNAIVAQTAALFIGAFIDAIF